MTNKQAWLYAASWGSYVCAGDPGACLYGFDEAFTVQSEAHRADCLREMASNRAYVEAHRRDFDASELRRIDKLTNKLRAAPVA